VVVGGVAPREGDAPGADEDVGTGGVSVCDETGGTVDTGGVTVGDTGAADGAGSTGATWAVGAASHPAKPTPAASTSPTAAHRPTSHQSRPGRAGGSSRSSPSSSRLRLDDMVWGRCRLRGDHAGGGSAGWGWDGGGLWWRTEPSQDPNGENNDGQLPIPGPARRAPPAGSVSAGETAGASGVVVTVPGHLPPPGTSEAVRCRPSGARSGSARPAG
jgi:hypothetical protein